MNELKSTTQDGFSGEEWYTNVSLQVRDECGFQTVSARELYKALNITDRFSRWFDSLLKYGFVENEDFTSVKSSTLVNNGAERELLDYAITIDMAKQICMLQRSELGRKYREYLLKLEKAWNTPEAVMSRALQIANRTLEEAKRQVVFQQAIIEEQKPKVAVYNELVDRSKTLNFRDMAAKLGMKQSEFMAILKDKYIYKTPSGEYRAYADFQEYFTTKTFSRGVDKTGEQLLINMEGVTYFLNKYKQEETNTLSVQSA